MIHYFVNAIHCTTPVTLVFCLGQLNHDKKVDLWVSTFNSKSDGFEIAHAWATCPWASYQIRKIVGCACAGKF